MGTYADILEIARNTKIWSENGIQCRYDADGTRNDADGVYDADGKVFTGSKIGGKKVEGTASAAPTDTELLTNATVSYETGSAVTSPVPMVQLVDEIHERTGGWPRRIGDMLFVHEKQDVTFLRSTPAAFGWLSSALGVIEWRKTAGCCSKEEVFHELKRRAQSYLALEYLPHEPPIIGHYYICPPAEPGNGSAISELIDRFCPETELDRQLILAMFATVFWGGAGGSRPAFVIVSDAGRGSGKSKITDAVARLAGGLIELSQNEDATATKTRLLSPEGANKRIARLDNVKSHRFSSAELESLITSPTISGKQMYIGEGSRPNTITWLITFNGASFSTDMAQRSVIIKVVKPRQEGNWEAETMAFIDQNRERLINDLVGFLQSPAIGLPKFSRWAAWEAQILAKLPDAQKVQDLVAARSRLSDVEGEEIELIEDHFYGELERYGYDPATQRIHIPSRIAAEWYNRATHEKKPTIAALKVIAQFIQEGRAKCLAQNPSRTYGRGLLWTGAESEPWDDADYQLETKISERSDPSHWRNR